jgi:hypothetical protein
MSKLGDGTMANGSWSKGAGMARGGGPLQRGAQAHINLMWSRLGADERGWGAGGLAPARAPPAPRTYVGFYKGEASWSPLMWLRY